MDIAPGLFSEHQARAELGFIENGCRRCVARAEEVWTKLCDTVPRLRKAARGRGRNALFNELVADFAREEFSSTADVDICEQYGTVRLHVKEQYDLGFKKVDKYGRSSNYLTTRHGKYDEQLPLWGEKLPEAKRIHIGYQWNNAATEIIDVYLVYPMRRTPLVFYSLSMDKSAIPSNMKMPTPTRAKARFRSKIVKDDKAGKKKAE